MKKSPIFFEVYSVMSKTRERLFQIFMAFSENLNFKECVITNNNNQGLSYIQYIVKMTLKFLIFGPYSSPRKTLGEKQGRRKA